MEQILSWFHKDTAPIEGLSPTITISELDGDTIITSGAMEDVGGGCYVYDFLLYDKTKIYIITSDGGSDDLDDRYQHTTNKLDSYQNKADWGKGGGTFGGYGANVDYGRIVKEVRNPKTKDLPNGSIGAHIMDLNTDKVISAVMKNKTVVDLQPIIDYIKSGNSKIISKIKAIPDQTQQIEELTQFIDSKIDELKTNISENNLSVETELKNIVSLIPQEVDYDKIKSFHKKVDFSPLLQFMEGLKGLINFGNEKIDSLNIENIDYGIIKDYIDNNKQEFQTIVAGINDKLETTKDLLIDNTNNDENVNHFIHLANKINEIKELEEKTNSLNRKYLFSIYSLLNGISNSK